MFFSPPDTKDYSTVEVTELFCLATSLGEGRGGSLPSSQWECSFQLAARWSRLLSLSLFFKGHNRVFLIRRGARPIDADASLQELASRGRENKRKYSKERTRGRNFTILFPFSLFERTYSSLREEGFRVLSFVVVHFPFVEIYQWKL